MRRALAAGISPDMIVFSGVGKTTAEMIAALDAGIGQFNIDVVGFGVSRDTLTGHDPGDEAAARAAARGLRLVRNMLMASYYTYLGADLRGTVGQRWVSNVASFQPQATSRELAQSVGARLTLSVRYDEFSPQYPPVQLEYMANRITRASDGRLLVQVDFDFTP
jgi:hypothetical protein